MILVICAIALVAAGATLYAYRAWVFNHAPTWLLDPALRLAFGIRVERDVMISMSDGVRLATDIYYPSTRSGPLAAILVRTPYGKTGYGDLSFVRAGYVLAKQDMRGRFHSEGEFTPYAKEGRDGSDTLDWLSRRPWSNGRIGTIGCSAPGETQLLLARERNPRHAALVAMGAGGAIGTAGGRYGYFGVFEGGVFNLASGFGWFLHHGGKTPGKSLKRTVDVAAAVWALPVAGLVRRFRDDPTDFDDFVSRPLADPYWRKLGYISDDDRFSAPALLVNTWHDQTVADTLVLADLIRRNWDAGRPRVEPRVVIGPGNHCDFDEATRTGRVGDLTLGRNAARPYQQWFMAWFDHWLRDRPGSQPDLPPYRFYVLGEDRWVDSATWPPRGVSFERWYLNGTAAANSARGGGTLGRERPDGAARHDAFRYDPADPVPTRGGPVCCTGNPDERPGPVDQREVESRDDVLVYTSAPLAAGLRLAGPIVAELFVSSSAPDTDFVAKLVDVRPDGTALNIQEGALRMRYRDGYTNTGPMRPGEIYLARVDLRAIAYYLPPGHRLRLQVSSSNFPRLERNLNTGGNNFDESVGIVALNQVYTTREHASSVIIPEWRETPAGPDALTAGPAAR